MTPSTTAWPPTIKSLSGVTLKSLGGSRRLGCRFLTIAPVKPVDAPSRVHQLLFAGEKRMASRTDFHVEIAFSGGPRFERLATCASNSNLVIIGVNSWLHFSRSLSTAYKSAINPKCQTEYDTDGSD